MDTENIIIEDVRATGLPPGVSLNPMQNLVHPYMDEPVNMVVASQTGSGKTTVACMLAHKHLFGTKRRKVVYVAPMKALVEEKRTEWSSPNHPYAKLRIAIITGDYATTAADHEANSADILVITPESLASRVRNSGSDKNAWIHNVGLLIVDEIHLIGEPKRGASLEAAIMEFSFLNPTAQLLGLSATIPNVKEILKWLDRLNHLDSVLITSDYRPVPLTKHYIRLSCYKSADSEVEKIDNVLKILRRHPGEQALVCVFSKAFGRRLEEAIAKAGIPTGFHNADKTKAERENLERAFIGRTIMALVCTQTLIVGMNLPARIVIITACTAARADIPASTLQQAAGRAGRPRFDTEGDVYLLLPPKDPEYHKARFERGEQIVSQMKSAPEIALHFLGAIKLGRVGNVAEFLAWFRYTLRNSQKGYEDIQIKAVLDQIVTEMTKRGMVIDDEGRFSLTRRGVICSQMAVDPFYLFDLVMNFNIYDSLITTNKLDLANALGSCSVMYSPLSKQDKTHVPPPVRSVSKEGYWSAVTVYYSLLRNEPVPPPFIGMYFTIKQDIDRIAQCLFRLGKETEGWKKSDEYLAIPHMFNRDVSVNEAILISQGASKSQAKLLVDSGVENLKTDGKVPEYRDLVKKIMDGRFNAFK